MNYKWQQNRCYNILNVQSIYFGLFSISLFHSSFCALTIIHFSEAGCFKLIHQTQQLLFPHDQLRYTSFCGSSNFYFVFIRFGIFVLLPFYSIPLDFKRATDYFRFSLTMSLNTFFSRNQRNGSRCKRFESLAVKPALNLTIWKPVLIKNLVGDLDQRQVTKKSTCPLLQLPFSSLLDCSIIFFFSSWFCRFRQAWSKRKPPCQVDMCCS